MEYSKCCLVRGIAVKNRSGVAQRRCAVAGPCCVVLSDRTVAIFARVFLRKTLSDNLFAFVRMSPQLACLLLYCVCQSVTIVVMLGRDVLWV